MNDNKATILKFPDSKMIRINPENGATGAARQKLADKNLSDNITANLMVGFVLDNLEQMYGINIDDPEFSKFYSFVVALFQATLYKYYDIPHPLGEFIDNHVKLAEDVTPVVEETDPEDLVEEVQPPTE